MAQLVISEAERAGRLALVPAVLAQGMGKDRAFMRVDQLRAGPRRRRN